MADELQDFKVKLGKRIKFLRESKKLTQPELGALVDKDYQSIGRIENGRINTSAYLIYQIA
ncbi:MAG: XRE family transcriptional regulator, partial [Chitinophagaceae bacterium]